MDHSQINNDKFYTAIVVREAVNKEKVFHKYHNIPNDARKIERFQRNMYFLHPESGRLIHINYYNKDNKNFAFRWVCNWV